MEIKTEILKIKQLNGDQKLVLALIVNEAAIPLTDSTCFLTTQEIATELGITYTQVGNIFWELLEMGIIKTDVYDRRRKTKTTALYKRIIKHDEKK